MLRLCQSKAAKRGGPPSHPLKPWIPTSLLPLLLNPPVQLQGELLQLAGDGKTFFSGLGSSSIKADIKIFSAAAVTSIFSKPGLLCCVNCADGLTLQGASSN